MKRSNNFSAFGITLALLLLLSGTTQAVVIDWVTVGNPGNPATHEPATAAWPTPIALESTR